MSATNKQMAKMIATGLLADLANAGYMPSDIRPLIEADSFKDTINEVRAEKMKEAVTAQDVADVDEIADGITPALLSLLDLAEELIARITDI